MQFPNILNSWETLFIIYAHYFKNNSKQYHLMTLTMICDSTIVIFLIYLTTSFNLVFNLKGASVAKWLAHLPFTSEAAGSSLSENFLNATRTQSSCEKSKSQRSAESRGFPPGTPVSSHRES